MKKKINIVLCCLLLAGIAVASYVSNGHGKVLTATTTPTVLQVGKWASEGSVVVTGSETVYFMKNCTTNDYVLTNGIPVTAGFPYTFRRGRGIDSVCYATASGSSEFLIAFE